MAISPPKSRKWRGEFLEGFSLANAPEFDDWAGLQDVVYTEAGDARRQIYHRRAFESLQTKAAQHPERSRRVAAELAHHTLAARLPEPAFHYNVVARAEAEAIGSRRMLWQILDTLTKLPFQINSTLC